MRLLYFIVLLILLIGSSCANEYDPEDIKPFANVVAETDNDTIICSYEEYMTLLPIGLGAQGSACFEDFFVQGYANNANITIYNLKDRTCLETIEIPAPVPSSKTHANTLNFGSQRYDSNDYFPLLYISSGYSIDGISYIYVYRIIIEVLNGKKSFSVSLVQTISIHFGNWTEGIIDTSRDCLWIKSEPKGYYSYACFKTPNVHDGDVDIYYEDNLKNFLLDRTPIGSRNQGHLYKDGKILLVTGVPSSGEIMAFISIDTEKEVRDLIINLGELGLVNPNNPKDNTFEPESVIIYNGQLMICYRNAIYAFNIERKKKDEL